MSCLACEPSVATPPVLSGEVASASKRSLFIPLTSLNEANFISWIAQASAGQAIAYHEGLLTCDRSALASNLPTKERNRLHALAQCVWRARELGIVHLYSQRLGAGRFRYLAMRSNEPLSPAQIRTQLRNTALRSIPRPKS